MSSLVKHIIIADDDPDDLDLFKTAVNDVCPDVQITFVRDGEKLINLLDIVIPDALVLDLNMPCKTGKQCLEEIRKKNDFNDVPIAILSTSKNKRDVEYCLSMGAQHYFEKPSTYKDLKKIVSLLCADITS